MGADGRAGQADRHRSLPCDLRQRRRQLHGLERPGEPGDQIDRAAALAELHDAEPEAHHAGQAESDLETGLRHVEGGGDHRRPDRGVAAEEALSDRRHEGDEKEGGPDPVEQDLLPPQHGEGVQSLERRATNRATKSSVKSQVRKVREAVAAGNLDQAQTELRLAAKKLDRAGVKRVIHPNAAARTKSRLAHLIKSAKDNAAKAK